MFVIHQPTLAVCFCLFTMLCWGSWTNAQKFVTQSAPLYVFYRDYVYGILLSALALAGGVVFSVGNMLLTVGISIAGISVAMPVGTGLSLAIGLVINYLSEPKGSVSLLAIGGGAILVAMVFSALAYQVKQSEDDTDQSSEGNRGIWIALGGGLVAGFFFWFVAQSVVKDLADPEPGSLTPYTGFGLFAIALAVSNPLVEYLVRRFALPDKKDQLTYPQAGLREHLAGLASGVVWGIGMIALLLGTKQAGDAVSYGLSQGATIVSVLWGLFVWHEFEGAPAKANRYLWMMGLTYLAGLILIVLARS